MITSVEAHNTILTGAPKLHEKKIKKTCEVGRGIRQGDLYVIRINDAGTTTIKGFSTKVNIDECTILSGDQLAPGNTNGSRHTIREGEASYWVNPTNSDPVFGGVVKAEKSWSLEHPEHAHWELPEGCYAIFYQLDWQTKQRVQD